MKYVGLMVLVAAAFAGCSKEDTAQVPAEPTPPPAPLAVATPEPEPPPTAAAAPAPAATPAPELAPEGVFYLITAARIETSSGVHGLPPGTGVKRVREGIYLTPAGELPLAAEQLTNDLAVARSARNAALANQAALQKSGTTNASMAAEQAKLNDNDKAAGHAAALKDIERQRAQTQLNGLRQQKINIEAQIEVLRARQSKENYNEVWKGRTVTSTTTQQLATARAQLKTLENQMADFQRVLNSN